MGIQSSYSVIQKVQITSGLRNPKSVVDYAVKMGWAKRPEAPSHIVIEPKRSFKRTVPRIILPPLMEPPLV